MKVVILAAATLAMGMASAFAQNVPSAAAQGRPDNVQRPAVEGKVNSTTRMNATTPDAMATGQTMKPKKMKKKKKAKKSRSM